MIQPPGLCDARFHTLKDGKRLRYAIFEPKNVRGTMLVAPGRREFIEKKYAELGDAFLQRGFRTIFFEWRGQGLSDRFLTGALKQRDYVTDFNIHLDDLDHFSSAVLKPFQDQPVLAHGHSMGGHLILRWIAERRASFVKAALLTAPMLALSSMPVHTAARAISWTSVRLGHGVEYAAAQHDYDARDRDFATNPLTHDPHRFIIMEKYFAAYPAMTMGGVTWNWLEAALKSIGQLQHRRYFDKVALPLLTITGGNDSVTPPHELDRVIKNISGARHAIIPHAFHDILNELDLYRTEAWREIDGFLARVIPV